MSTKRSAEDGFSRELKKRIGNIRRLLTEEAVCLKPAYEIGVEVQDVRREPDKYGKGAVKAIARDLGCTEARLYSHATVAAAWTQKEFTSLAAKTTAKGAPLEFSHFVELAKATPESRKALLQRALDECLSVRGLRQHVRATKPARERARPKSVDAVLRRLHETARDALRAISSDKALVKELLQDGDDDLSGDLVLLVDGSLRMLSVEVDLLAKTLEIHQRNSASAGLSPTPLLPAASIDVKAEAAE